VSTLGAAVTSDVLAGYGAAFVRLVDWSRVLHVGVLRLHHARDEGVEFANRYSNTTAEMKGAEIPAIDIAGDLARRLVESGRCLSDGQQNGRFSHAAY
jgi:hypothetical protein